MGLFSFIGKQFIDVIEWENNRDGVLAEQFKLTDNEIQHGASLTVRETQQALFVDEGQIADVFLPGRYTLNTQTLPVLTNLKNWDKFFQSPFKSDIYFFSTREQLDCKWGTSQPITIREPEFGMIRLRAFGIYSYHVLDAKTFFQKVSGTQALYHKDTLDGMLRNTIIAEITEILANSQLAFLDMAANQSLLAKTLKEGLAPFFSNFGLSLDSFSVQNLSLPEELQKALDTRMNIQLSGNLNQLTQYNVASSIPIAAANSGGLAGVGAEVGVGAAIGQAFAQTLQKAPPTPSQPESSSPQNKDVFALLEKLHALKEKGILTEAEFAQKKTELLSQL